MNDGQQQAVIALLRALPQQTDLICDGRHLGGTYILRNVVLRHIIAEIGSEILSVGVAAGEEVRDIYAWRAIFTPTKCTFTLVNAGPDPMFYVFVLPNHAGNASLLRHADERYRRAAQEAIDE